MNITFISARDLRTLLDATRPALGKDETRPWLQRLVLKIPHDGPNKVVAVASDGTWLAEVTCFDAEHDGLARGINYTPAQPLDELYALAKVRKEQCFEVPVKRLEETFPAYEQVIPPRRKEGAAVQWGINPNLLATALRCAAALTAKKLPSVAIQAPEDPLSPLRIDAETGAFSGVFVVMPMRRERA